MPCPVTTTTRYYDILFLLFLSTRFLYASTTNRDWIVGFGLGGDPGALMKLSVDHKVLCSFSPPLPFFLPVFIVQIFSADFFRESLSFVSILDFVNLQVTIS